MQHLDRKNTEITNLAQTKNIAELVSYLHRNFQESAKKVYDDVVMAYKNKLSIILLDEKKLENVARIYPDIFYYYGLTLLAEEKDSFAKNAFEKGILLEKGKNSLTEEEKCIIIRCMMNCPKNYAVKDEKLTKNQVKEKANNLIKKKKYNTATKLYDSYLNHFPLDKEIRYLRINLDLNYNPEISETHVEIYQWTVTVTCGFPFFINQVKEKLKKDPDNPELYRELSDYYFFYLHKDLAKISNTQFPYCIEYLNLFTEFTDKAKDQQSIFSQNLLKHPLSRKLIKSVSVAFGIFFNSLERNSSHPELLKYFIEQNTVNLKKQHNKLDQAKKEFLHQTDAKGNLISIKEKTEDKETQKSLKKAIKLFKLENYESTIKILEELMEPNTNPLVGMYLALCYARLNKNAEAEDLFTYSLELCDTSNNAIIDLNLRKELLDILLCNRLTPTRACKNEAEKIAFSQMYLQKARQAVENNENNKALCLFHEALSIHPKTTRGDLEKTPLDNKFISEIKSLIKISKENLEYKKALQINSNLLDLTPLETDLYFSYSEISFLSLDENSALHLIIGLWLLGDRYKQNSSQNIYLARLNELIVVIENQPKNIDGYLNLAKHICILLHLARIIYVQDPSCYYLISLLALEKCKTLIQKEEFQKSLKLLPSKQLELLKNWLTLDLPKRPLEATTTTSDTKPESYIKNNQAVLTTPPSIPSVEPVAIDPVLTPKKTKKIKDKQSEEKITYTTPIVVTEIKVTPTISKDEIGLHFFKPKKTRRGGRRNKNIISTPKEAQKDTKDIKTENNSDKKSLSPSLPASISPLNKNKLLIRPAETYVIHSLKNNIDVIIIKLQNILGKDIFLCGSGIHYLRNNSLNRDVDDFVTEVDFSTLEKAVNKYNTDHKKETTLYLIKTSNDLKDLSSKNKEFSKIGMMEEKNDALKFTSIATICHNSNLSKDNGMILHAKSCDTFRNSLLARFEFEKNINKNIVHIYDPLSIGLRHLIENRHQLIDNSPQTIGSDPIKILRLFHQAFRDRTRPSIDLNLLISLNLKTLFTTIPIQRLTDHIKKMLTSLYQDPSHLFYGNFNLFFNELNFTGIFQALSIEMQGLIMEYASGSSKLTSQPKSFNTL